MNCAVCPAVTVAVDPPEEATTVAAGIAVPVTEMDCGELAALSVMVSVVVRMPEACGEKTIEMVHVAPAAIEPLQVSAEMLKSAALKPLRTALRICKEAAPELVSVTFCGEVEVPCVGVPGNVRADVGLKVTAGAAGGGATAMPESGMACGLPVALSVMKRVAMLVPTALGA